LAPADTTFADSASISPSVSVAWTGWITTSSATDFMPSGTPAPR
jgi:hypothetical protein